MRTLHTHSSRERGSVLIVGLVFLLIMTMLTLTNIAGTSLQEHMAGNTRDRALSFSVTEVALRDGEDKALNTGATAFTAGTAGYYESTSNPAPASTEDWDTARIDPVGDPVKITVPISASDTQSIAADRRIEKQPSLSGPALDMPASFDIEVFKVAAQSGGPSGTANVILETTYRR